MVYFSLLSRTVHNFSAVFLLAAVVSFSVFAEEAPVSDALVVDIPVIIETPVIDETNTLEIPVVIPDIVPDIVPEDITPVENEIPVVSPPEPEQILLPESALVVSDILPGSVNIRISASNFDRDIGCGGLSYWGVQVVAKDGSIIPGQPAFVPASTLSVDFSLRLPSNDYSEIMFTCSGDGANLAFQHGSLYNDVNGNQIIFSYINTTSASIVIDVADKNSPIATEGLIFDDEEVSPEELSINEILSVEEGQPAGEGDVVAEDIGAPETVLPVVPVEDTPAEVLETIPTDSNTYIPPTDEIIEEVIPPVGEGTNEIPVIVEEIVTIPELVPAVIEIAVPFVIEEITPVSAE